MNVLRKAVTTLGGVFLAALLITALAPKAARGIAATLVQVTNTSANPVPTVSDDANFPYEAFLCVGAQCQSLGIPGFFVVPSATTTGVPVKRLVIENLNANCNQGGPVEVVTLSVPFSADNNNGVSGTEFSNNFLLSGFSAGQTFGQAVVRIYADPSGIAALTATSPECFLRVSGHLETK